MFLVFDYDGVIIDSSPAINRAVCATYEYLGFSGVSREVSDTWMGPSIRESIEKLCRELGIDESRQEELEKVYFESYVSLAPEFTEMFGGIGELLTDLATVGVPKALATMKAHSEMQAMSRRLPGLEFFDIVAAPELHLGGSSKKDLVAQAISGLREAHGQVIDDMPGTMIGDRASDIAAGKAHGLRTIAVAWGAGTPDEITSAGPDHVVTNVAGLRKLLL